MKRLLLILVAGVAACDEHGGGAPAESFPDAAPAVPDAGGDPETLADTGLYDESGELAPGVVEYTVNWQLWADGAEKRRFVRLPEGETIDSADMDFWTLPIGTRIWKEFSQGGVRIETRFIWKRGPELADWYAMAFGWNAEGSEAVALPDGERNALGTMHDIPRANDCRRCHNSQPDFALGFSALQLDHDDGEMNLGALVAAGALSDTPAGSSPYFPLPGDEAAQAALGYLHGNCGGCHHARSPIQEQTPLQLRLASASLGAVEDTPAFMTAVGQPEAKPLGGDVTAIIQPHDRDGSAIWVRMGIRGNMTGMPPLATEAVDDDGREAVGLWIDEL